MTDTAVNYDVRLMPHAALMEAETMGKRIENLMSAKGLTQSSVGRILGVRRATVHQWVRDISQPTPANLIMLAELLGTDVHYLVFGPSRQPEGGFPTPAGTVISLRRRRNTT